MGDLTYWVIVLIGALNVALLVRVLFRLPRNRAGDESGVREELRIGRDEANRAARESRDEIAKNLRDSSDTLSNTLTRLAELQHDQLEDVTKEIKELSESNNHVLDRLRSSLETRVKELQASNEQKLEQMSCGLEAKIEANEGELSKGLATANQTLATALTKIGEFQSSQLAALNTQFKEITESNQCSLDRMRQLIDTQINTLQESSDRQFVEIRSMLEGKLAENRAELSDGLKSTDETLTNNLKTIVQVQRVQLDGMTTQLKELADSTQASMERARVTIDSRLHDLQESNEKKLEEMRTTVDEKLHDTLEQRLGQSFKLVGDQLEAVHRGLGDMQNLATGVGDLKRLLSNVKVRATWTERQVENLLEQFLAPGQYQKNFHPREDAGEAVEFAVRLPGSGDESDRCVWVPIDAKFPQEDYRRLQQAAEAGDAVATQKASDALMRSLRLEAAKIHEKYINPPRTTDFAIMFLGTEGLYSEALRHESLVEELQRCYRVMIAGPTTLAAIVTSYRMGFQTLAIERRAVEVQNILGAVKSEFGKFGKILVKVKRQLQTTTNTIDSVSVRTRVMVRKLKDVEQLSEAETTAVLDLSERAYSEPDGLDDLEPFQLSDAEEETAALPMDDEDALTLVGETDDDVPF